LHNAEGPQWVGSRDSNRKAPAKAIAAAPERPASGNACERIRKLISHWQCDELGAERKAARQKCSKALAPILDNIRKYAVHASLKAVDASRECPA
jgi:hypothetical protein